jgi:uncharacterized membrane protein YtjA (UPF0391 family)
VQDQPGESRCVERGVRSVASLHRRSSTGCDREKRSPIRIGKEREVGMLVWALVFLIVAIIAGLLGFGGVASTATGISKVLFFLFLLIFVVTTIASLFA